MLGFNSVTLLGNLTRDPQMIQMMNGASKCHFAIAINSSRRRPDGSSVKEVVFIDVACWTSVAEIAYRHLRCGDPVLVSGKLEQDRWTTDDGQQRNKHYVTAKQIRFFHDPKLDYEDEDDAVGPVEQTPIPNGTRVATAGSQASTAMPAKDNGQEKA